MGDAQVAITLDICAMLDGVLFKLHSNPVLDLTHVAEGIEAHDRNLACVRPSHSFNALHRICLAGDQPKDPAFADIKGDFGDGDLAP